MEPQLHRLLNYLADSEHTLLITSAILVIFIFGIVGLLRLITLPFRRRSEKKRWEIVESYRQHARQLIQQGGVYNIFLYQERQRAKTGWKGYGRDVETGEIHAIWLEGWHPTVGTQMLVTGRMQHGKHHNETILKIERILNYISPKSLAGWEKYNKRNKTKQVQNVLLTFEQLKAIDWLGFECLMVDILNHIGWNTARAHRQEDGWGADGGIDLVGTNESGEQVAIQCKAWKSKLVGVKTVRELIGSLEGEKGVLVGLIGFSEDAFQLAARKNIMLITGEQVLTSLNQLPIQQRINIVNKHFGKNYHVPSCPNCEIKMVLRNKSKNFWGCPNYPKCSKTMQTE